LMRQAYDREKNGTPAPAPEARPAPTPQPTPQPKPRPKPEATTGPAPVVTPPAPPARGEAKPGKSTSTQLAKLVSLRDQGILTEDEFQAARRRLVGTA
jgi:outer membrane biosynthesis protein TonB